jgi:hypothetical protein
VLVLRKKTKGFFSSIASRVTRLGDFRPVGDVFAYWAIFHDLSDFLPIERFSPIERLFTLGSFFYIKADVAQFLWLPIPL